MERRINKLRSIMEGSGLDHIFITDEKNMHYLSGFYRGEGYLVISRDELILVTDSRYTEYAKNTCSLYEVKNIRDVKFSDFTKSGDACGFEDNKISYRLHSSLSESINNLKPIGDMVDTLRYIKDADEIELIKRAASIADMAYEHILGYIKPGVSERDIACEIDYIMRKYGSDGSSFATIAASGANASLPHAIPTDKRIENGDFIVLDFGCVVGGYCSDMTRTVALGCISEEKKKIYDTVLKAQLMALSGLASGRKCSDIDKLARDYLDKAYKGAFSHSLGHSVGLDIHESPNLSPSCGETLAPGMIITVEPGVYLEGNTGVRIEDLVCIGENNIEILSEAPKNLTILG